jgi:serine protease AprX
VPAEVTAAALDRLAKREDVVVWPNSAITLLQDLAVAAEEGDDMFGLFDLARSAGGTDCRPFRPGVSVGAIRQLLGVAALWNDGFRGQNIIVGIIDEGVHSSYPVVGGHETATERRWARANITSHGSMCAADVLVAAPAARLYDYPFLGQPRSGGALAMLQAVLDQHRADGTPHLTNNSYGFVGVPTQAQAPRHEVWDLNHPVHRKVREVVATGIACFFAAGNCGSDCPSGACHPSGIGPGQSIHASNSLLEVITVAAVNSRHERIGYSSQGPGMFEAAKPDIAAYSHFFANFGPGRPGGTAQPFDNGTSAATPVACGIGAALLSAFADLTPDQLKAALMASAIDIGQPGQDFLTGAGVVNAATAYHILRAEGRQPGAVRAALRPRIAPAGDALA